MTRSISARLTALFAACASVVFLVSGVVIYQMLQAGLVEQVQDELKLRGAWLEAAVTRTQSESQWRLWFAPMLRATEPQREGMQLWVVSDDPVFRYGQAVPGLDELARTEGFGELMLAGHPCTLVTWTKALPADGNRPAVRIVLARDPQRFWATLSAFRLKLFALGAAGVIAVAALGFGIARWGLSPLRRLSRQAQVLDPNHPNQRLALKPMPAELDDLTASFNGALERLEAAYRQLEAFNADVAHELRTPLTNLIGQTQVTLTRTRSAPELEDVLHSNLEEMERLKGIVNDMLFLARADQGAAAARQAPVAIEDQVHKVLEYLEPMIEDRNVQVTLEGQARCAVEAALLRRALSNLLRNAIEHSATGTAIAVHITQEAQAVRVAVSNPGAAIDSCHLPHLFDRFYRIDSARCSGEDSTGQVAGSGHHGLGLAIVKAIAVMHRGVVFARSEQGLNTFGLTLSTQG